MAYTNEFNEKFKNLGIEISFIPTVYQVKELKRNLKKIKFTNADEYLEFLTNERDFWKQYENNVFLKTYLNAYNSAISNLNTASTYTTSSNCSDYIRTSVNYIDKVPNSKSILTKELIKYKDLSQSFYNGFIDGIRNDDKNFSSQSKYYAMGLYKAFQYTEIIRKIDDMLPEQQESFENTQLSFINTANEYIKKYDELFVQKEQQFIEMDKIISSELSTQKEEHKKFLEEKNKNIHDLEKLYAENLRLKKPADYWKQMSMDYEKKAKKYIGWSIGIGIITVALLSLLIVFVPETTQTSHWFDLIKNTAILTVITTILVYALRVFVRMAMSSYHLSRDAREREQLTYFYLSLINEKAVTDSERELIITSLFSRSDTGLLKGDSSPEMPTINLNDFLNNKK